MAIRLPFSSYIKKTRYYSKANYIKTNKFAVCQIYQDIDHRLDESKLTKFVPSPQPHSKPKLENISIHPIGFDIDFESSEPIEDGDLILQFEPQNSTSQDSAFVFTAYK